ncbi:MAG: NAD(P)-dependent oxidoreductase [Chloroflexi bacterium]|nr:NAD(P)-dependent oxidoreductase [Chloroflexota bacterium]
MSIMVTGGTGFIGNKIVRKLVERGEDVIIFDLAPPRANLEPYLDRIQVYRGDILQVPHLLEAVNTHGVHKIIHMAALLPPDTEDRPHFGMLVNIQGTNNVFEVARWTGIQRVVYASSIAAFGVQETFGDRPVNEDDLAAPVNVYGMTKAANDFAAAKYSDRYGLDLIGVRICTVFGHGRVTGMTGIIGGLMMSLPAVGKPVSMPYHQDEPSPMIHAEDAAEIFVRAVLSDRLNHRVYISGGHLATIADMADLVRGFIPDAQIATGDQAVPHIYRVDNSRMLADIGYELAPLRVRVLEHINDARAEAGMAPIGG